MIREMWPAFAGGGGLLAMLVAMPLLFFAGAYTAFWGLWLVGALSYAIACTAMHHRIMRPPAPPKSWGHK